MKGDQHLKVGDKAPAFQAIAVGGEYGDGRSVALRDFRGTAVVFYFYPKDDTPGCTTQACSLRDSYGDIMASGAALYGISPDDADSHRAFRAKFALPFPLLVDAGHAVADAYGAWGE